MSKLPEKLQASRMLLVQNLPYFATGIYSLTLVEDSRVDVMAVDKYWRVYYNPERLEKMSVAETAGAVLHELEHLLREHGARAGALGVQKDDELRWNIAADFVINNSIRDGCFGQIRMIDGAMYPERFGLRNGLLEEEYFEQLQGRVRTIRLQLEGSGAGPSAGDWELGVSGLEIDGEGINATAIRYECAAKAREHFKAGKMPGGLSTWVDGLLGPSTIPWQQLLRSAVRRAISSRAGVEDYTWARRSRRTVATNVLLPGMTSPELHCSIVIDTSGSMQTQQLQEALRETNAVLRALGLGSAKVHTADVQLTGSKKTCGELHGLEMKGRGGTDMARAIEQVIARDKPSLVIVMTDGETGWPEVQPHAKVVACLISKSAAYRPMNPPDWIKTIRVGEGISR